MTPTATFSPRAAAKEAGAKKYKSGDCPRRHGAERWTANYRCVECQRLYQSTTKRVRNPEERKRANAKYYGKPGAMRKQVERTRSWRQRNKEKFRAICRNYYLARKSQ